MGKKISIWQYVRIDIILVSLFMLIPMILYLNTILKGVKVTWPLFIVWLAYIIFKRQHLNKFLLELKDRKLLFFLLFLFIGFVGFNYYFVRTTVKGLTYFVHFINYALILIIHSYYAAKKDYSQYAILFFIIIGLGIQALISIPYLLTSDGFVVRLFSSGQLTESEEWEAIKHGIGNNGLYSSLGAVALVGISVLGKNKAIYFTFLTIAIIAIILTVFISTFFASILLLVVGILIILLRYKTKILNFNAVLLIGTIGLSVFLFYDKYVKDTRLLDPIIKKYEGFTEEGKDVTGRTDLSQVSWNTFLENPFFGIGVPENRSYKIIGEHMPWIDFFANFGFFGFLPLLLFFIILIKGNWQFYIKNDSEKLYRSACLAGAVIFLLSNFISPMIVVPNAYLMFLFFYAPSADHKIRIFK